jgi:hypothetical protein
MSELTQAQSRLLVAMYTASSTRQHDVNKLGFKMPVLRQLVRKGCAVYGKTPWGGVNEWRGKLTSKGRSKARSILGMKIVRGIFKASRHMSSQAPKTLHNRRSGVPPSGRSEG